VILRKVSVENFRAFHQAELRLPETGLALVAGANNSGKSALLSAIDVIAGVLGDTSSLRHIGSLGPCKVNASFSLTKTEREQILARASDPERLMTGGVVTTLEFEFSEPPMNAAMYGLAPLGLREIRCDWSRGAMIPLISTTPEQSEATQVVKMAGFLTGPVLDSTTMIDQVVHIGHLAWLDQLMPALPMTSTLPGLIPQWRSRYYHFRALRQGTERTQKLESAQRLEPTGANLSAVLLGLATDQPQIFEQLGKLIAEIVPEIGRLQVRTIGGQQVVFEAETGDINLKDLGTGVEQLLMVLVVGLTEASPFLLLIEEPETNLHPAAQRALLGLLQSWSLDRQILAATHSTVMLDWAPGGEKLWLVARRHGSSGVNPVGEDRLTLLHSLGVHPSDILSAERVIIVEGPSDEEILSVWFPDLLRNPRVAVLHGEGGDNARHAARFADWLSGTERLGLRQVLYIRDRDELAPSILEKLSNSPTVHVLARRELENYLLNAQALASVFAREKSAWKPPSIAEIEEALLASADSLRNTIIVNRVARQIVPAQPLMDNRLRRGLAGSTAEGIIAAVQERLMAPAALRDQVTHLWDEASNDVGSRKGNDLLDIAPGKDILDMLFMRFAKRHYKERTDGTAIARSMSPPVEIARLIEGFLSN
jgi:predicted ATPase